MHHPPEVRFLVDGTPWVRRLLWVLGTLTFLQMAWFFRVNSSWSWQTIAVGSSLIMAVGFAWAGTKNRVRGHLHWDGAQWHWSGMAGGKWTLQSHLDFQTLMLVSLYGPAGSPIWLWLQRTQSPVHWLALRRAVVYSTSPERGHRSRSSEQSQRSPLL